MLNLCADQIQHPSGHLAQLSPCLSTTGAQLEKLMEQLRSDLSSTPPLPGSYSPKRGDLCAAKFSDGEWYRGRVEKVTGNNVSILYVDYGNVSDLICCTLFRSVG